MGAITAIPQDGQETLVGEAGGQWREREAERWDIKGVEGEGGRKRREGKVVGYRIQVRGLKWSKSEGGKGCTISWEWLDISTTNKSSSRVFSGCSKTAPQSRDRNIFTFLQYLTIAYIVCIFSP